MKKRLIVLGLVLAMALPAVAFGQSSNAGISAQIAQLQAQVKALMAQIESLKAGQSQTSTSGGTSVNTGISDTSETCVILNRSYRLGEKGEDIKKLQDFLKTRKEAQYPETVPSTGFYGSVTMTALQNWQKSEGIASSGTIETTGWGAIGPATMKRIREISCGGNENNGVVITLGQNTTLPRNAVGYIGGWGGDKVIITGGYACDGEFIGSGCTIVSSVNLSFSGAGKAPVNVVVTSGIEKVVGGEFDYNVSVGGIRPGVESISLVITKLTSVSVTSPVANTLITAPLTIKGWLQGSASNEWPLLNGSYGMVYVYNSSGRLLSASGGSMLPDADQHYNVNFMATISNIELNNVGSDTGYLLFVNNNGISKYKHPIRFTGGGMQNYGPVIHGVSGPTSLKIGEAGTWTVRASDPENGVLDYQINWGDEKFQYAPLASGSIATRQTTTFTHAYQNEGVYQVVFYVTDNAGNVAKSSISVTIGRGVVTTGIPVLTSLSPNTGPVGTQIQIFGTKFETEHSSAMPVPSVTVLMNGYTAVSVTPYVGANYIYFTIPEYISPCPPNNGGVACMAVAMRVVPGTYDLTVKNAYGVSNTLSLNVTDSTNYGLRVTSPNGGETYKTGDNVAIRWVTEGLPYNAVTQLNIKDDRISDWTARSLFGATPALNHARLVSSSGNRYEYEYMFTVPANFDDSLPPQYDGIFGGSHYKIDVIVVTGGVAGTASQKTIEDYSDRPFNLYQQMNIVSPNGGESWRVGSNQNIVWYSVGGTNKLGDIKLIPETFNCTNTNVTTPCPASVIAPYTIASDMRSVDGTNKFNWGVGKVAEISNDYVPFGQYRVQVCSDTLCDSSDNYFKIVDTTVRGDCNLDGVLGSADSTALTLEIGDGDGVWAKDALGGTFRGSPYGCDANADTKIDAGDASCLPILLFGGSCSTRNVSVGDVNGDGLVDSGDSLLIMQHVKNMRTLTSQQISAGDVNGDGMLTMNDALAISQFDVGRPFVTNFKVGDVNYDGKVDGTDLNKLYDHADAKVLLDYTGIIAGDVNNDGLVNRDDAITVSYYTNGYITKLPTNQR